jgi:hypothetical protein
MDEAPRVRLVVLRGGRANGDAVERAIGREDLRVIPGGPAGDVHAAIEETVLAARQMRREIEERIARALDELF